MTKCTFSVYAVVFLLIYWSNQIYKCLKVCCFGDTKCISLFLPCFTESEFHFAEISQTCNWEKGNWYVLNSCPKKKKIVRVIY